MRRATRSSSGSAAGSWPRISPPRLLPARADARGQTTVEWLAVMVGFAALVTVLAGDDIWSQAGQAVVDAVNAIFGSDRRQGLSRSRRSRRSSGARRPGPSRGLGGGRAPGGARPSHVGTDAPRALAVSPSHTTRHPRTPRLRARPGHHQLAGRSWSASSVLAGALVVALPSAAPKSSSARRRTWSPRRPAARSRTATTPPRSTPTSPTRRPAWSASARARRA